MAAEQKQAGAATTTTTEFDGASWLDQATTKMKVNDDPDARKRGLDALTQFIQNSMTPGQTLHKEVAKVAIRAARSAIVSSDKISGSSAQRIEQSR